MVKWLNRTDAIQGALAELEEELSLPALPRRMECYDISHIQGSNLVGSMVVFDDGKPFTRDYRRFKIKAVEGIDDYASMKEMLTRRFKRLSQAINNPDPVGKVDTWGVMPDLVIIDGGKGIFRRPARLCCTWAWNRFRCARWPRRMRSFSSRTPLSQSCCPVTPRRCI